METPTDMEIVQRVQAGDAEAFGLLVHRYSGRLYADRKSTRLNSSH